MRLADIAGVAASCRESMIGLRHFSTMPPVNALDWPDDVIEQFLYDHADNGAFLHDYADVDLTALTWHLEVIPVEELMVMPTGASDGDCIEEYAADPAHWVRVRNRGIHVGVAECWETHGTWKRWPVLIDRAVLDPPGHGLQIIEGRTRIGVLRGRQRQGAFVAERHLAWTGRPST